MFQNMGPSPSGRSGHAMSSIGTRVFVLGGESFTPAKQEDYGTVHVLDTSSHLIPHTRFKISSHVVAEHIKYPDSSKPPTQNNAVRKSSIAPAGALPSTSSQSSSLINGERAMSPNAGDPQDPRRAMSLAFPKCRARSGKSALPRPPSDREHRQYFSLCK